MVDKEKLKRGIPAMFHFEHCLHFFPFFEDEFCRALDHLHSSTAHINSQARTASNQNDAALLLGWRKCEQTFHTWCCLKVWGSALPGASSVNHPAAKATISGGVGR
jgi:hypothetical protein